MFYRMYQRLEYVTMYLIYPISFLIFLHDGSYISQYTTIGIAENAANVIIKPDILGTILWIIITLFPLIYHVKILEAASFLLLSVAVFFVNVPSQFTHSMVYHNINPEFLQALLTSLLISFFVYKQYSLYQQILHQHSWFNANHENIWFNYKYIKWIMYFISNISMYLYCFLWSNQCDQASVQLAVDKISTLSIIIYYFLPRKLKYDLYFHRGQIMINIMTKIFQNVYLIFYTYLDLQDPVGNLIHTIIVFVPVFVAVLSLIASPYLFNRIKQNQMLRIVSENDNTLKKTWQEYILLSGTNFHHFGLYLIDFGVYANILFVIEVSQYKNAVIRRLNVERNKNIKIGITDINGLNASPMIENINSVDLQKLTLNEIKSDIWSLYERYIESVSILYATFVNRERKTEIEKKLQQIDDFEILNVFDNECKKVSHVLQLLYREYIIDKQYPH